MTMEQNQVEDRRLVQKLIRYFIFRSIQVILQSRSSKVFRCSCKVYSPQVSLGLSLEDDPSIAVSIKGQFSSNFELRNSDSHSVEIYLCSERSPLRLYLEVWTFQFSDEDPDPAIKRMKTFDRLVVALKALWSVSRALPAYRIARRQQTSDKWLMCFNIRRADDSAATANAAASSSGCCDLGADSRERRVASVRTAAGRISLSCFYRASLLPEQLEAALLPASCCEDDISASSPSSATSAAAAAAAAAATAGVSRCLATDEAAACTSAGDEDSTDTDDDDEEDDEDDETTASDATVSSSDNNVTAGIGGEQHLPVVGVQEPPAVVESPLTDSQLAACFADVEDDDAAAADPEVRSRLRLELVERLKSLNRRLNMFSGCGPLSSRIGAIPQQLDFFERDLAEFDLLLNDILAREDAGTAARHTA